MSIENLSEYYSYFVYGLPVGAFLSGIIWAVAFAVDSIIRIFKSA